MLEEKPDECGRIFPENVEITLPHLGNPSKLVFHSVRQRLMPQPGGQQHAAALMNQALFCIPEKILVFSKQHRAKGLLSATQMSFIDIASAVGIEDQSYFSRFFRKHTGHTPTEYRKLMQGLS